jgi:hypothetical protein
MKFKKDFIKNHLPYFSPLKHIIPYICKLSNKWSDQTNIPTECDTLPKLKKLLIKKIDNTNKSYLEYRIPKYEYADYDDFYENLECIGKDYIDELYKKIKIPTYEALYKKYHPRKGRCINYKEWVNTPENSMMFEWWYKNSSYRNEVSEKTKIFIITHLNRLFTTFVNRIKCKFLTNIILQFIDNSDYYIIQSVQLYHYEQDFVNHIFKDRLVKNYIISLIKLK